MGHEPTAIDWESWTPEDIATLCFIRQAGQLLLIHKKRGLGAGKINGPGGRLDPGESPRQCAVRECQEELAITPLEPVERGLLEFQFADGYRLRCHVFEAAGFSGTPVESEEAVPLWVPETDVPYDRMWADDQHWLPILLTSRDSFLGRFVFDEDRMMSGEVHRTGS